MAMQKMQNFPSVILESVVHLPLNTLQSGAMRFTDSVESSSIVTISLGMSANVVGCRSFHSVDFEQQYFDGRNHLPPPPLSV